jgi:hypothetical protein
MRRSLRLANRFLCVFLIDRVIRKECLSNMHNIEEKPFSTITVPVRSQGGSLVTNKIGELPISTSVLKDVRNYKPELNINT